MSDQICRSYSPARRAMASFVEVGKFAWPRWQLRPSVQHMLPSANFLLVQAAVEHCWYQSIVCTIDARPSCCALGPQMSYGLMTSVVCAGKVSVCNKRKGGCL